jgi:hypothetical protein
MIKMPSSGKEIPKAILQEVSLSSKICPCGSRGLFLFFIICP